jgi:sirohydrochlorin cobaltochelatase
MPMTSPTQPRGIILLAHGSRDPLWRVPIEAVAARIRASAPGTPVRCAYLVRAIRVFPLFFGVGKHAREDLPLLVGQVQASHPGIAVELLPTAGEYPELSALMAAIALA